jgi:hypothetical protein
MDIAKDQCYLPLQYPEEQSWAGKGQKFYKALWTSWF